MCVCVCVWAGGGSCLQPGADRLVVDVLHAKLLGRVGVVHLPPSCRFVTRAQPHSRAHARIRTHPRTRTNTHIHSHAAHARTHTHTHTHTHTLTHMRVQTHASTPSARWAGSPVPLALRYCAQITRRTRRKHAPARQRSSEREGEHTIMLVCAPSCAACSFPRLFDARTLLKHTTTLARAPMRADRSLRTHKRHFSPRARARKRRTAAAPAPARLGEQPAALVDGANKCCRA